MTLSVSEPMLRQLAQGVLNGLTLVSQEIPSPGDWLLFVAHGGALRCQRQIAPAGVEAHDFGSLRITLAPL